MARETNLQIMGRRLNDEFRYVLNDEMQKRYGFQIETSCTLDGDIVSYRLDRADFTQDQLDFMKAFGDGYAAAMVKVQHGL